MKNEVLKQVEALKQGLVDFVSEEELARKLESSLTKKKPLRIKYGADPSAPDLHLGHTVPLRKLKQFQDLGHKVVFIIGDFTARIGDPTQRNETRRMLSREEVNRNAISYQHQVFEILDSRETEVRYNSEWLGGFGPEDFLNLTARYTVARMLERDDFSRRYRSGHPIAIVEFLYPLLQGYDSIAVNADVEIGGTDQLFNLLVGREFLKQENKEPQIVMTLPIIEGTDGVQKMSKTLGNAIGLEEPPKEMFGKIMSIPDSLMERYYRYLTGYTPAEAENVIADIKEGRLHPREAKARLAEHLVSLYHGTQRASKAREEFDKVFQRKGLPEKIETIHLGRREFDIVSLLKESGLVSSKGEARRLIRQGGVKVEKEKVTEPERRIALDRPVLIQCGKRKFARLQFDSQGELLDEDNIS